MRKFLLLTDCVPSPHSTAGIMVAHLCRLFPKGSLCCFAVVNEGVPAAADLNWMPLQCEFAPRQIMSHFDLAKVQSWYSFAYQQIVARRKLAKLVPEIVRFAQAQGVEAIWCQLQGLNLIRLARPVAEKLGVPLFTQVLDPPTFILRLGRIDCYTRLAILKEYGRAISLSERTAAISPAMAEDLQRDYGTETVVVRPGFHRQFAQPIATEPTSSDTFAICIAGQGYASDEVFALMSALNSVNWQLAGKQIVVRFLGRRVELASLVPARIEYHGFHAQASSMEVLHNSDLLYAAYWLDPSYAIEVRQAFPSKLSTYLAAGRPVLFHGPLGCSPDTFLAEHDAVFRCHSNDRAKILEVLERAIVDRDEYAAVAYGGRTAFEEHLTLERQRDAFAQFLGVDAETLNTVDGARTRTAVSVS